MKNPIVWFEVLGQDTDKLVSFYGEMFAWPLKQAPAGMDYHMVEDVKEGIPGGMGKAPEGPGWTTFYVRVESVEESLASAKRLGGNILMPLTVLPDGMTIAVISDPEGHPVGMIEANK